MQHRKLFEKAGHIVLYLCVLYYLLPFRPAYLYFIAYHPAANPVQQEQILNADANSPKFLAYYNFPQKDKSRFDVAFTLAIAPLAKAAAPSVFTYRAYFLTLYSIPNILCNSNRGPPAA
jgi:hypothetical protein